MTANSPSTEFDAVFGARRGRAGASRRLTGIGAGPAGVSLDTLVPGGMLPGQMLALLGKGSCGRTSLACQVLCALAHAGHRCLYASYDHAPEQLRARLTGQAFDRSPGCEERECPDGLALALERIAIWRTGLHPSLREFARQLRGQEFCVVDPIGMFAQSAAKLDEALCALSGAAGAHGVALLLIDRLAKYEPAGVRVSLRAPRQADARFDYVGQVWMPEHEADIDAGTRTARAGTLAYQLESSRYTPTPRKPTALLLDKRTLRVTHAQVTSANGTTL